MRWNSWVSICLLHCLLAHRDRPKQGNTHTHAHTHTYKTTQPGEHPYGESQCVVIPGVAPAHPSSVPKVACRHFTPAVLL